MELIYIGKRFEERSKGVLGEFYDPRGKEYRVPEDIRKVLESGEDILVRPATMRELENYEKRLDRIVNSDRRGTLHLNHSEKN